jgi:hypothetical protein
MEEQMATLSKVKQQRKELNGRETYERFAKYCKAQDLEPTEDHLAQWDEKLNQSRIRASFGNREDVYQLGLKELYRRFLNTNCLKIFNGPPVKLSTGATYQPYVNERRKIGDHFGHLREVTAQQVNVIREQFKTELRQLLRTQKYFNLSAADIREDVLQVLKDIEDEKS